jgi:hypothetical protein
LAGLILAAAIEIFFGGEFFLEYFGDFPDCFFYLLDFFFELIFVTLLPI